MEIVRSALDQESFSFQGKHFQIPVPGIPDRGSTVQELTLIPRPLYPYEIWQAVTSPPTLDYVPVVAHGAVFWNQHYAFIKRFWDTYGERYAEAHGVELAPHEKRMLVVAVRVEDSYEKARETALPGHDEFWKFLGPYGWSRGYMGPDGKPAKPGLIPTLDESLENKTILLGTPEQVAEGIQFYRDLLGLEHLTIFPHMLGDPYKKADEQMARFITEVLPLVSSNLGSVCVKRSRAFEADSTGISDRGDGGDSGAGVGGADEHAGRLDHDRVGVTVAAVVGGALMHDVAALGEADTPGVGSVAFDRQTAVHSGAVQVSNPLCGPCSAHLPACTAVAGLCPWWNSRAASCRRICGWASPPIVPNTAARSPPRVASAGESVCGGRRPRPVLGRVSGPRGRTRCRGCGG